MKYIRIYFIWCTGNYLSSTYKDQEIIEVFTELYQTDFSDELLVNHNLPIEIRAFRRTDIWAIF